MCNKCKSKICHCENKVLMKPRPIDSICKPRSGCCSHNYIGHQTSIVRCCDDHHNDDHHNDCHNDCHHNDCHNITIATITIATITIATITIATITIAITIATIRLP